MSSTAKSAFDKIYAEEQLKESTLAFLKSEALHLPQKKHRSKFKHLAVVFACLLALAFTGAYSFGIYFTETMYVDIDINPSIELAVNRFGRIIGVHAYNSDGQQLLSQLDLKNMLYSKAMAALTEAAIDKGFLSDGGLVSVTLQSDRGIGEDAILQALQANISAAIYGHCTSVQIDTFSVDSDTRDHAHAQNLSPAKYLAILDLLKADPAATVEGCRNHTIDEIRSLTEAHGGGHHGESRSRPASGITEESSIIPTENYNTDRGRHHGNTHHGKKH